MPTTATTNQAPSTIPIDVINFILHWVYGWSGSDYIRLLTSYTMRGVPLDARHKWADLGHTLLEKHDPGPCGRKWAEFKSEGTEWEWRYSIGWGGTEVIINPREITVISYAYVPGEENKDKGRCIITADRSVYWKIDAEAGHSWGRLQDLHFNLEKSNMTPDGTLDDDGEILVGFRQVNVPDEVTNFVHDMEVGGGF